MYGVGLVLLYWPTPIHVGCPVCYWPMALYRKPGALYTRVGLVLPYPYGVDTQVALPTETNGLGGPTEYPTT